MTANQLKNKQTVDLPRASNLNLSISSSESSSLSESSFFVDLKSVVSSCLKINGYQQNVSPLKNTIDYNFFTNDQNPAKIFKDTEINNFC